MEEVRLAQITQSTRARTRGGEAETMPVSREEKEAEALILRSFLQDPESPPAIVESAAPVPPGKAVAKKLIVSAATKATEKAEKATIEIGLVKGGIESVSATSKDGHEIDVVAVGHYPKVRPQAAERALDEAISACYHLPSRAPAASRGESAEVPESELLITLLTDRGHIPGNLGEPFILPDPRQLGRFIVLAGMGEPGRFGVPELTVLSQELCWSVGRLQKRHLATALIGAGTGNLTVKDAVEGWIRGIGRALLSSAEDVGRRISPHYIRRTRSGRLT